MKPPPKDPNERSILHRLAGLTATQPPRRADSWYVVTGRVILELDKVPELQEVGGAVRLEGSGLPSRILVFTAEDGGIRAICNECPHHKRRLDPVPGSQKIQCCSMGKSTFTWDGEVVSGASTSNLPTYNTDLNGKRLIITLPQEDDLI